MRRWLVTMQLRVQVWIARREYLNQLQWLQSMKYEWRHWKLHMSGEEREYFQRAMAEQDSRCWSAEMELTMWQNRLMAHREKLCPTQCDNGQKSALLYSATTRRYAE